MTADAEPRPAPAKPTRKRPARKTPSGAPAPRLRIEVRKVSELLNDPANARTHSRKNLDAIKASLRRFDLQKPIVVDAKGVVRAGNGTLIAAAEEGWEWIEVVVSKLAPSELTAFGIADNRTGELSAWDTDALTELMRDLDPDLQLDAGFTIKELDAMFADPSGDGDGGDDDTGPQLGDTTYRIVVECRDEKQQQSLLEKFEAEGLDCRAVMS